MKKNSEKLFLTRAVAAVILVKTAVVAAQPEPAPAPAPPAAEAPADAPPATEPPVPEAPAAEAAPLPPDGPAVEPGPVPAPAPAPAAIEPEAAPPAPKDAWKKDPVKVGVGLRVNLRAQDPGDPESLGDVYMDQLYAEARLSGQIHELIAWQANFNMTGRTFDGTEVRAMDLIAQFNLHDYFNVWVGRLLVPVDRSNFSGPFFMSPWYYPGFLPTAEGGSTFVGPRTEANGRDVGGAIWGQFGGGTFKYYAGAFNLDNQPDNPLFSGRLNLALLDTEPGFYHSSTYYGAKKQLVALGVGAQYQKDILRDEDGNQTGTEDYTELNADLLAEFELNGAGTITGEAGYYKFSSDDATLIPAEHMVYVLGSYLFPEKLGIGKLQPLVRYQRAIDPDRTLIDAEVGYIIADYNAKVMLGYQRSEVEAPGGDVSGNALHLGVQVQH